MSVFIFALIIAIFLPIFCSLHTKFQIKEINENTGLFLALLLVQITSEGLLTYFESTHLIKYTSAFFVLIRLAFIIYLYRFKYLLAKMNKSSYYLISLTYWLNFIFWTFILNRLILKF